MEDARVAVQQGRLHMQPRMWGWVYRRMGSRSSPRRTSRKGGLRVRSRLQEEALVGALRVSPLVSNLRAKQGGGSIYVQYLGKPLPKLLRQRTPRQSRMTVRNTDAEAMMPKNCHSTKVHRKVGAANIDAQPARYRNDKPRKASIGSLYSRRTDSQPYISFGLVG